MVFFAAVFLLHTLAVPQQAASSASLIAGAVEASAPGTGPGAGNDGGRVDGGYRTGSQATAEVTTDLADRVRVSDLAPESSLHVAYVPGRLVRERVGPEGDAMSPLAFAASSDEPLAFIRVGRAASPAADAVLKARIRSEARRRDSWLGLMAAQHGAAAFDAFTTRSAISSGGAVEANPLLRPFAGNNSLYAAIQVGPTIIDYVARKMMTSQHGWMRTTWWIPQTLGAAVSLATGAHNLGVRSSAE